MKIKKEHIDYIRKGALVLLVFAIFKAITFIAPLGVNYIFDSLKLFGEFEYSLNFGQALMGIISMGFAGAYAYFIIRLNKQHYKPIFHLHFFVITCLISIIVMIFPSLLNTTVFTSFNVGVVIANQVFLSAVLKLNNKNKLSIIADSGLYIIMGGLVLLHLIGALKFSIYYWNIALVISLLSVSFSIHLKYIKGIKLNNCQELKEVYKFGGLIIIAGPLLVLITASTRLYIEYFLTKESVGLYSYFFRIASVSLIFSRVFIILMYRKLFLANHDELDSRFSYLIYSLFGLNFLIFLLGPVLLEKIFPFFAENIEENRTLFLLCLFQITFWVTSSLYEPLIQRENKLKQFILVLALCNALLMFLIILNTNFFQSSLKSILWINSFVIFVLVFGQNWILRGKNIYYRKSIIAHSVTGVFFLASTLFIK